MARSGRTENLTPFKKGQSGNPGGRPAVLKDIRDLARVHTSEALAALVAALARPGERVAAASALLDRGYGKPAQALELAGKDGGPIQVEDIRPPIGTLIMGLLESEKDKPE